MRIGKYLVFVLLLALTAPASARAQGDKTQVRLVLSAEGAKPGDTVMAGVEFRLVPGWHTYWRNAGDSGSPVQIKWTLPPGVTSGEIQWPLPRKLTEEGLTTYVYDDTVVLLVPLSLASTLAPGTLDCRARVEWLECEKQCVQRNTEVGTTLRIGATAKPSTDADLIQSWQKRVPPFDAKFPARAWWEKQPAGDTRPVIIEWDGNPAVADFFPFAGEKFDVTTATQRLPGDGGRVRLRKTATKQQGDWPLELRGVLLAQANATAPVDAREVHLKLQAAPGPTVAPTSSSTEESAFTRAAAARPSLVLMLGFAFLGGLILNIMPCVLPVIALKILGFVQQSKEAPRRIRKLGLIYALGVLASFLALAAVVIGVQQVGHTASWGMQFQNPQFVVGMTALVTLVALNLFGVFEITLSGRVMGAAGNLTSKEGAAGAFFNGVLATALATPCTAPALGTALGFAFTQAAPVIVLMFLTVGLGLAAPYVVLSWEPAWLRFLPKPGAWMEKFKVLMGFPMLATAVWLLTVASAFFGEDSEVWLGLFLVGLAMAAWVWGEFVQRGRKRKGLAMAISVLLVLLAYGYVLEGQVHWRSPIAGAQMTGATRNDPEGIDWQPWSPEAVAAARAQGRPVFVDFTAKWCLTCQVNKRTSIEIPSVKEKLKEIRAVALIENSLVKDAAVVAELERHGRDGVPLVLVYPRDPKANPIVLPEFLTPGIVLRALDKAVQ